MGEMGLSGMVCWMKRVYDQLDVGTRPNGNYKPTHISTESRALTIYIVSSCLEISNNCCLEF